MSYSDNCGTGLLTLRGYTKERIVHFLQFCLSLFRSSRSEMFCGKGVLKNFVKLTVKHLSQGLFFNKVAGLACNFIKKRLWYMCFSVNFTKFLRAPLFTEHLRWLLPFIFRMTQLISALVLSVRLLGNEVYKNLGS